MIKHYVNLSNGLEALAAVQASGDPWAFARIRSTTLEYADWDALFCKEVPDDLLMHLALGWTCVLHDRGTRRPLSKTCYFGVPLISYVLQRHWSGQTPSRVPMVGPHGGPAPDASVLFGHIYTRKICAGTQAAGALRARLNYFGRYWNGSVVEFTGRSLTTTNDGDLAFQRAATRPLCIPADPPEQAGCCPTSRCDKPGCPGAERDW